MAEPVIYYIVDIPPNNLNWVAQVFSDEQKARDYVRFFENAAFNVRILKMLGMEDVTHAD